MKAALRIVIAASLVTLASCGSAKRSASPPTMAAPGSSATSSPQETTGVMPGDKVHDEIEQLSAKVEAERTELGLAEPSPMAAGAEPATPMAAIPLSTDASCKPAKTERCQGSCKLSDSICTNASRICDLAKDLAGDGWAATKCSRAKQTCDTAHDSCCSCH
jgi:hypothetical protein